MMLIDPRIATTSLSWWPIDHAREHREVDVARRPRAGAVGPEAAVADDVEAKLAVGRFRRAVDFVHRHRKPRFVMITSKCWISPSMLR